MTQEFYRNEALRKSVYAYIVNEFEKEAVEMVFMRADVSHIADAKDLLDKAFSQMEVEFGAKKKISTINEAR